jgi:hypothetical protein
MFIFNKMVPPRTLHVVRHMFPGRVISRFGDIPWPPRSPDLSTCDFILWGYPKSHVYAHNPLTLADLKETIKQESSLNLAFKHMDITCLTLFFTDNMHFKWH